MTSTSNLPGILRSILDRIDISLPNAAANFVLFNTVWGELEPVACRNIDETRWRSEYLSTDVAMERAILQAEKSPRMQSMQVSTLALRCESYREQGLVSYLGVPVTVGEHVGLNSRRLGQAVTALSPNPLIRLGWCRICGNI